MTRAHHSILAAALVLAGCGSVPDAPISMSLIGGSLKMADPNLGPIGGVSRTLLGATAQGLVGFDASDQIQPALAERWIVTDDGLSYIFRIREATWPDGTAVTSADVARSLERSISPTGRNPLRALFSTVTDIIPMTGEVIEIRIKSAEPNFLQLLAQPEMAILKGGQGSGPYHIHSRRDGVMRLRPYTEPVDEDEVAPAIDESKDVRIRSERAALAISRFNAEGSSYLSGGTFLDLPIVQAAKVDSARFQVDPAYGLFGLAVSASSQTLKSVDTRLAVSMAIDRDALIQPFGVASWHSAISVLPAALGNGEIPAAMSALQAPLEERRARARSILKNGITIRVALPEGPGARLLFAGLAADWRRVGVRASRVQVGAVADLYLIDEVAPVSSGLWYLERLSCGRGVMCDPFAQQKLDEALQATDLTGRVQKTAKADATAVGSNMFIPLAMPLRWSLTGTGLVGWRKSAFSIHPFPNLR